MNKTVYAKRVFSLKSIRKLYVRTESVSRFSLEKEQKVFLLNTLKQMRVGETLLLAGQHPLSLNHDIRVARKENCFTSEVV